MIVVTLIPLLQAPVASVILQRELAIFMRCHVNYSPQFLLALAKIIAALPLSFSKYLSSS